VIEVMSTKATRPNIKITLRRVVLIAVPIFIGLLIWAVNARVAPVDPALDHPPKGKLPLWIATLACIFAALTVGMISALTISNFRRWRVVLHPNLGRVLGAIALSLLTPLFIFSYIPWILGPTFLIVASGSPFIVLLVFPISILLWYPVSCLLVSGVGHRVLRVALFSLTWWGAYSIALLYWGYQVFLI